MTPDKRKQLFTTEMHSTESTQWGAEQGVKYQDNGVIISELAFLCHSPHW